MRSLLCLMSFASVLWLSGCGKSQPAKEGPGTEEPTASESEETSSKPATESKPADDTAGKPRTDVADATDAQTAKTASDGETPASDAPSEAGTETEPAKPGKPRPSVLLQIMMEPLNEAMDSATSGMPLPGVGR
jgi:hypothetical protein